MTKIKKIKSLRNEESFNTKLEFMKGQKLNFQLLLSNYTSELICPSVPALNFQMVSSVQSNRAFIGNKVILRDLREWSGNEIPNVNKEAVKYFDSSDTIEKLGDYFQLYNIDLKSAYLKILFNNYFIQKKTFDYIMSFTKKERLVCVGMLASSKRKFYFIEGENTGHEILKKNTEGLFYYCVQETYKIIDNIKQLIGNDFVFSWVDSVYFLNIENKEKIESYLKSINFENSFKVLENVNLIKKKNSYLIKYGYNEEKNFFNIPINKNDYNTALAEYLKLKNK